MNEVRLLGREDILQAQDLVYEDVLVPEWGGTARVRGLTGAERDWFENSVVEGKGKNVRTNLTNIRAKLVSMSVVDGEGKRLFTQDDVVLLGRKSAIALERVAEVAQRISGLRPEDVEELAKNSDSDQSDDSISG